MPAMHAFPTYITFPRVLIACVAAVILALTFMVPPALAQWPTSCVELNDVVERDLGNEANVGIYQRVFGDQAEQACQRDHRADVQSTFAWAISTPATAPAPAPAPAPPPATAPAPTPAPPPPPAPTPVPTSASIGEVLQVVASPFVFQDGTVWLGTSTGGVLRSTNAGASFTQGIRGLPNLTINAIVPSPTIDADGVVMVATNNGIARSTDRGQTWAAAVGLPAVRFGALAASPRFETDGTFYAVADTGMAFRSTDRGANWFAVPVQLGNHLPAGGRHLGMVTADGRGDAIHILVWTSTDVYESTNRGAGFMSILGKDARKTLSDDLRISTVAIHPDWRYSGVMWIGSEAHGIYRSTDRGQRVEQVLENTEDHHIGRVNAIAVSPNVGRDFTIAAGTERLGFFLSKIGGERSADEVGQATSWQHQSTNLGIRNVRSIAFSNGFPGDRTIFVGGGTHFAYTGTGAIDWYTYPSPIGPAS